jgi:hypothetical protein
MRVIDFGWYKTTWCDADDEMGSRRHLDLSCHPSLISLDTRNGIKGGQRWNNNAYRLHSSFDDILNQVAHGTCHPSYTTSVKGSRAGSVLSTSFADPPHIPQGLYEMMFEPRS